MADNDRWRNDPERYRYRDEDRDRFRGEGEYQGFRRGGRGEHRGGYGGSDRERYGASDYGEGYRGAASGRDYGGGYGYGGDYRRDYGDYRGGRYGGEYRGGGYGYRSDERAGRTYGGGMGGEGYAGGYRDYGRGEERGFWDRASDEVSSWFGDEDAERRRRMDEMRGSEYRGRGPKGYTRSDDRIREDVCDRLTDDPFIDASDIDINVSRCEVTLSGTVDSRKARRRAEDMAEQVSGVTHVQNNLRVKQDTQSGMTGAGTTAATGVTGTTGSTSTTMGTTSGSSRRKTGTTV